MNLTVFAIWCIAAYLVGSISWSYIFTWKLKGYDLRTYGSGNLGATNAGRLLGKKWAVIIYLLDFGKGVFGTCAGVYFTDELSWNGIYVPIVGGFLTVIGHIFPFYLNFKGGKGVATGSGVVFALAPWTGLCALGVWVVVSFLTRLVSAASVLSAISLPIWYPLLAKSQDDPLFWSFESFLIAVALLVTVMHHTNIKRILRGEEDKSWVKKK
ncbi:MAG: glycerol-3-phosphate acyltransferase PlsY [Planctomycetota bacterium]|jgi:glycerol-3-phosphate acyltransferase PlsY